MTESGFEGKRNEDRVQYFGQREEQGGIEANKILRELSRAIIVFYEQNRDSNVSKKKDNQEIN